MRGPKTLGSVLSLGLAACVAGVPAQPQSFTIRLDANVLVRMPSGDQVLHSVPITVGPKSLQALQAATDDGTFAQGLGARLEGLAVEDVPELARRSGPSIAASDRGGVEVASLAETALRSEEVVSSAALASTFLVDFEEPAVQGVAAQLVKERGPKPSPREVRAFVRNHITKPGFERVFDVASNVAASRAGDCTEYAVLTTALLRQVGTPARMVLGIVIEGLLQDEGSARFFAGAHAWVEYHDGQNWRVLDAALAVKEGSSLRRAYVPLHVMRSEGLAYKREVLELPQVRRVVLR